MNLLTENIWTVIKDSVSENKQNLVAVAYFGQRGSELLPLKENDVLVVDASKYQIQSGLVDPRELLKLVKVGVKVFSYPALHAKVYVLGEKVFVGSANVSENSRKNLKEAMLKTNDPGLVDDAKAWIKSLAFSPLSKKDLQGLIPFYNPPKTLQRTVVIEKCLFLVNVDFYSSFSDGFKEPLEIGEKAVVKLIPEISKKEYDCFEYSSLPEFEIGDYLIIRSKNPEGKILVNKPCRVLHIQSWGFDEKYFVFYSKPQGIRISIGAIPSIRRKKDGFLTAGETRRLMDHWNLNLNDL